MFTVGMEASSVVESSFSAFQRALGGVPTSFVGVVQQHVKKDNEKLEQERSRFINDQVRSHDHALQSTRSDAENECAMSFSNETVEDFISTNHDAQNYAKTIVDESEYSVCRRAHLNNAVPPKS